MKSLCEKEASKRAKYDERVSLLGGSFTPLVYSDSGTLAPESSKTLGLVVRGLDADAPERRATAAMQQVSLQMAIVKATSLCLRARSSVVPPESRAFPLVVDDCPVALGDARLGPQHRE